MQMESLSLLLIFPRAARTPRHLCIRVQLSAGHWLTGKGHVKAKEQELHCVASVPLVVRAVQHDQRQLKGGTRVLRDAQEKIWPAKKKRLQISHISPLLRIVHSSSPCA